MSPGWNRSPTAKPLSLACDRCWPSSPAPPAPEPKPVSVLHNRALTVLSSPVALPVPADAWTGTGEMTCELWVRPDGDAASGAILSLGASTLSLNGGRLHLESGNAETPASVEASGQPFAAGTWHHVAVALGTENVRTEHWREPLLPRLTWPP